MSSLDTKSIAAHVIVLLAQAEGRVVRIDELAEEIGMQEGDVVIWVNRQPTGSLEDIRKVQAKLKEISQKLRQRISEPLPHVGKWLAQVLHRHYQLQLIQKHIVPVQDY